MAKRPRRESKGRQKLELVKMKNESNLHVTFSKRHQGICKKVHELFTLTGANAAVIGFSPKNKPFSFGCPNVPCILEKYQNPAAQPSATQLSCFGNLQNYWGEKIMSLEEQIREEKRRGETLDAGITQRQKYWWEVPAEELTLEQSEKYKMDLLTLRAHLSNGTANPEVPLAPTQYFGFSQYAPAFPSSSIDGGNFASGASPTTVAGCSLNRTADFNPMETPSATAGSLEFAGPSRINTNVQLIPGEKSSIDLQEFDSLLDYFDDDSEFLNLFFD